MRSLAISNLAVAGLSFVLPATVATPSAHAFQDAASKPAPAEVQAHTVDNDDDDDVADEKQPSMRLDSAPSFDRPYMGVNHFFNIREANSDTAEGEIQFELTHEYVTRSRKSDDFKLSQAVRYGLDEHGYIELRVDEPLGTGGEGAGEIYLTYFRTYFEEQEWLPAFANSFVLRIPTGVGSSKVDATFNFILTKTIVEGLRFHLNGFVQTANGEPGHFDFDEDRLDFQWGVGPGFDLKLSESVVGVLNYLHRSAEIEGEHNQNLLEMGTVHMLPDLADNISHNIRFSTVMGLDGNDHTPNWGCKIQWSIGIN